MLLDVPITVHLRVSLLELETQRRNSMLPQMTVNGGESDRSTNNKALLQQEQPAPCVGCIEIQVIFHPIQDSAQQSEVSTTVTGDAIETQMRILNMQFVETPFTFRHSATRWHTNDAFAFTPIPQFTPDGIAGDIAAEYRQGGADIANVFLTDGTCQYGNFASIAGFKGVFPSNQYSRGDYIFLCPRSLATYDDPDFFYFISSLQFLQSTHLADGSSLSVDQ